ncbi:molybdenum cofactor biosynthesis protein MoaE [Hyphomicrobium nitrativorans NL23]|uniref:Molybdopterin synthase catalytic subunit n=1 Tax=Hyphomicrobium nitrativorans NL23 TaxID=1029756 RepID=V5SDX5_9HYPH|nr:molybdenum cofactor biosynthesis protein MoaE [Hyphomicrobium nitrativorans]AHB48159.1 molybdenum cofactor biosynthesis protein MoaE [Hyphomicrobium nitrativorans NL23]
MAVRVQHEPFDAVAEVEALTRGRIDVGGIVTFTGLVRGDVDGRPLISLTLEHYPGMTEAELGRIEVEARKRFDLVDCVVVHRVGELTPGEGIVLVVALSRHRQAAFEAAEFLMDYLKTRAPFWKKETFADGAGNWVDARDSDSRAEARWGGESATQK